MFVYQNKDGHICVTFTSNKPVENPEYVIAVDKDAAKLYMVAGTIDELPTQDETVVDEKVVVALPSIEVLDDVEENDAVRKDEVIGTPETNVPAEVELRPVEEGAPEDYNEEAPVTEADNMGVPSVEELDDVAENDEPVVVEDEIPEEEAEVEEEVNPEA